MQPQDGPTSDTPGAGADAGLAATAFTAAPTGSISKVALQRANAGSFILGAAALICIVLSVVQGFIPIFLIEGAAFGALSWLCAVRWPLSALLHSVVLLASLLISAIFGLTLDQDTLGPRYRYLSQGSQQYRVDERAGRTDELDVGAWRPVAFDREAKELPPEAISLNSGIWKPGVLAYPAEICFTASVSSGYVVRDVSIQVELKNKDGAVVPVDPQTDGTSSLAGLPGLGPGVVLKSVAGGFVDQGHTALICGDSDRELPGGGSWSFSDPIAYGWKR